MGALGLGLSLNAVAARRVGTAIPTMLPYTSLATFETLTGITKPSSTTITLDTSSRKTLGTAGVKSVDRGAASPSSYLNGIAMTGSFNFANFKRIAMCVDVGTTGYHEAFPNKMGIRVGATLYDVIYPASASYSQPADPSNYVSRGKVWVSKAVEYYRAGGVIGGARLDSLGTVSATGSVQYTAGHVPDNVLDAMVAPDNNYVPNLCIVFHDLPLTQLTIGLPILDAAGIKGTFYVPTDRLNGTTIPYLTSALANGHALCLDSGPNDEPATAYATPAAWITALQAMQATMISTFGLGVSEHVKHITCGDDRQALAPDFQVTVTCDGSTTINLGGSNGYYATPGQPVYGTGVPAGTLVDTIVSRTTITTTQAIPAGSRTLTFGGLPLSQAVTCDGVSNTITVADSSKMSIGFEVIRSSDQSANGLKITAIPDATHITLDGVPAATVVRMRFAQTSNPWYGTKAQDALIAAGFLSCTGGAGSTTQGYFAGFGLDVFSRMNWRNTFGGSTAAEMLERVNRDMKDGTEGEAYWHDLGDGTIFQGFVTGVKALIDAGTLTGKTKPVRIAQVMTFPGIS